MVRSKSNLSKVYMNYSIISPKWYKGRIESHVDRMIPYADLIQLTHLNNNFRVRSIPTAQVSGSSKV